MSEQTDAYYAWVEACKFCDCEFVAPYTEIEEREDAYIMISPAELTKLLQRSAGNGQQQASSKDGKQAVQGRQETAPSFRENDTYA